MTKPPRLNLTLKDKNKVERLYLKGHKPGEIAKTVGATPSQIGRYLYKRGLTRQRGEILERKKESTLEIWDRVLQEQQPEIEAALRFLAQFSADGDLLNGVRGSVQSAGDALAFVRAMKLYQERAFDFAKLSNQGGDSTTHKMPVNIFLGRLKRVGEPPNEQTVNTQSIEIVSDQ